MELKNLQRDKKVQRKVSISIKVDKDLSDFLRKKNLSPTKIFVSSVLELMKQNK